MVSDSKFPGNALQIADPEVSKIKFERELNQFMSNAAYNRERGIILIRATFPDIVLAFTAANAHPRVIIFCVKINFTNYDLEAPSVEFVDALTEAPVLFTDLLSHMPRKVAGGQQDQQQVNITLGAPLIQAHPPHMKPFLCLPGVKEYHNHPAHSNDPWLTHRGLGEGTLGFLIDQLHKYGTDPIVVYMNKNYNVQQQNGLLQIQAIGIVASIDPNRIPL
ncbi:putative metal-binding protein [Flavobacterium granuli]|uniref:Metal binding domain-containing protein n=1 Tax=Flavobacterium granuli TaxID=280093 RepID=A0ABU1S3R0_9FLAO|nr:putative metal-binding protein [Flavobacterium granuli]MDR6845661.1 hypothetical protein [Flavobacterium granuli]